MKAFYNALLIVLLLLGGLISCKELNDSYEIYVVPGGIIYPGKIRSSELFPGRHRVLIQWPAGQDPSITKARIFWDNYSDSLEIPISPSDSVARVLIEDLPEKSYAFVVKTYDDLENASMPVEILGKTYGELYQESLHNLRIAESSFEPPSRLFLRWAGADRENFAIATEIKYTDTLGRIQVKWIPAETDTCSLLDIQAGSSYSYRTVYLPEWISIDTFYTAYDEAGIELP